MRQNKIAELCETALFTALVFLGVSIFKFPSAFGYSHLGDCMIFLAVLMLGGRRGALAGGVGAALADLIGGYAIWVLPTLISKSVMALVMGAMIRNHIFGLKGRLLWALAAVSGGICQAAGYTAARIIFYGTAAGLASLPGLTFQTATGIVLAFVLSEALQKTSLRSRFRYTTDRNNTASEAEACGQAAAR